MTRLAAEIFCLAALLLVLIFNITNIEHPATNKLRNPLVTQLVYQLGIYQHFQMFGVPPKENPWFVYEAQLADGSERDIFRDREVDTSRPEWGRKVFPQFHWRKIHRNAVLPRYTFIRQPLLDYSVDKWNTNHDADKQVARARLILFKEAIGPNYNDKNFQSLVWGSYTDKSSGPGSLFESMANENGDHSF